MAAATAAAAAASSATTVVPTSSITGATSSTTPLSKKEAVAQLVGLLEDSRKADTNNYDKQLEALRKERQQKNKEANQLANEAKQINNKKRRVLKQCDKASTEDLLEVLRHRTLRAQSRQDSAPPASSENESESPSGAR